MAAAAAESGGGRDGISFCRNSAMLRNKNSRGCTSCTAAQSAERSTVTSQPLASDMPATMACAVLITSAARRAPAPEDARAIAEQLQELAKTQDLFGEEVAVVEKILRRLAQRESSGPAGTQEQDAGILDRPDVVDAAGDGALWLGLGQRDGNALGAEPPQQRGSPS